MKACDICLEKECKSKGGIGSCNCSTCKVYKECNRKLRATIRLTLKCTQSCSHCCFESSPNNEVHMTIDTAKKVREFLIKNEIYSVNLMGGEIYCNPDWREILDLIIPVTNYARIVSNGDWAINEKEFAEYLSKFENCYVCLSKDKWHTNQNNDAAEQLLVQNNVICKQSDLNETEFGLVPVGRARFSYGIYSAFNNYCSNPEEQYAFLIDEVGKIYKCGFGIWDYADINDYLEGGFARRFKEFNKKFYDVFISNCSSCIRGYNFHCK